MKINISSEKKHAVAKDLYGLFFEDINYSLDGGLHAEMLENRNFEAMMCFGKKDDHHTIPDGLYGWSVYGSESIGSYLQLSKEEPLNSVNPHYMIFHAKTAGSAFTNKAFDGIYLKKDGAYQISFYAKAEQNLEVTVAVCAGKETICQTAISINSREWKKYEGGLVAARDVEQGAFVVTVSGIGKVCFDQFSMMPADATLGIFRTDLVEALRKLQPSFMRFPGGCVVEGNTLDSRYRWKDTIAPAEERKQNWNRWAIHNCDENEGGPYSHYGQTLGVGYYEYFLLCEELGAKPLPVVSVGLACQFMSTERLPLESPELQEYIQDVIDLIEFCNGDVTTVWGAKRAEMGHPEPFGLEYVGIGNEQWQDEESEFFERYLMFEKAVHEKYPEIKLIGSAGPGVLNEAYDKAWEWIYEEEKKNPNVVYAMDEHYYVEPEWLLEHADFYDNYDRTIKVFAGEYACHIPGLAGKMNMPEANSIKAALAEAAFMTGIERNSDVVVMAAYAPLLARKGYTQWSPDLIWFDGKHVYETPSYYVQQLYSKYRGEYVLPCEVEKTEAAGKVFASAVTDAEGRVIVKLVNVSDKDEMISFEGSATKEMDFAKAEVCMLAEGKKHAESVKPSVCCKNISCESQSFLLKKDSFCILKF